MKRVSCSCGEVFEVDSGSDVVTCPKCRNNLRLGDKFVIKKKHVIFAVLGFLAFMTLAAIYVLNPGLFILLALVGGGLTAGFLDRSPKGPVTCSRCGSRNVQVVSETHTKGRGCLSALLNLFVMFFIWWIWLFVWLARGKKTINKTKSICLSCQNQWYV